MNRYAAIAAIVFALTLPSIARADDASHRAKAEEMISLMHTEKAIQQNADSIAKQVDDAADHAAGPDATPEQKAKAEDFKKQANQTIETQLGWEAMKPAVVDLYVKTFTEDQLDAIVAFYKTPAGAALLEKTPELSAQFGQLGNSRVTDLREKLQKAYMDLQSSLHPTPAAGASSPAPAASSPTPAGTMK